MIRRAILLLAALAAGTGAELRAQRLHLLDAAPAARLHRASDGALLDAWGLAIEAGDDPIRAVERLIDDDAPLLFGAVAPEVHVLGVRESLTGTHILIQQTIEGIEVVGGALTVSFDAADRIRAVHSRVARAVDDSLNISGLGSFTGNDDRITGGLPIVSDRIVYLNLDGTARLVRRLVVAVDAYRTEARYVDREGGLVMSEPLWFAASTRVFDPDPITRTGDTSLHDQNDAADAVPDTAYSPVDLPDVSSAGPLVGPNVSIVDAESPSTTPTDLAKSLIFDRSADQFEEVMAYFHLDRSQRYMQSLGFSGTKRIVRRSLRVDPHAASGADNSYYRVQGGEGSLFFGDGGVDDAEDPDILLHEYGHAIHEDAAPGAFTGSSSSQGRALGEGFGDYWAFSSGYLDGVAYDGDPYCIGDWDARCADGSGNRCGYPPGSTCLRRVDGSKTMADFIPSNQSGTEHRNGEIWSSALREIFEAIVARNGREAGRAIADRLVLESLFGLPVFTSFETAAMSILEADRLLEASAYHDVICTAMVDRAVLPAGACTAGPRGEFVESPGMGGIRPIVAGGPALVALRTIDLEGLVRRVRVRVEIRHPHSADLRLTLVAPGGDRVVLRHEGNGDEENLVAAFGADTPSDESLDSLRGLPAAGDWSLEILDTGSTGGGTLRSWSLAIDLEGSTGIDTRTAAAADSVHILAVANVAGALGTRFVSDVSIRNANDESRELALYFTPSGTDGRTSYRAVRLSIAPEQTVTIRDIIVREFDTVGIGNLEIRGDLDGVSITSRNYNNAAAGTYGQFIDSVPTSSGIGAGGDPLAVPQLVVNTGFRSNIGVTELGGGEGVVEVVILGEAGGELDRAQFPVLPWSHVQRPVLPGASANRARAEVRVLSGEARIAAYGSIIDNRSGDPIYVPAQRIDPEPRERRLPAAANVPGALGTRWRTDLWLTNTDASDAIVTLTFFRSTGGPTVGMDLLVPARGIESIEDVVGSRFGLSDTAGQIGVSSSRLIVTSRTWNENDGGTYGQFIPAIELSASSGSGDAPLEAIGLDVSEEYRTNIGFSEVAGHDAIVRVTILDDAGTAILELPVYIPANGNVQFGISQIGIAALHDGVARFEVDQGEGRIVAYASIVDNRSSDPTYVPARRTP